MKTQGKIFSLISTVMLTSMSCQRAPSHYEFSNEQPATDNPVLGNWKSPCFFTTKPEPNGERLEKSTRQSQTTFTESTIETVTKGFTRENCANHQFTVRVIADYKIVEKNADGTFKIDYAIQSITLAYHIKSSIEDLNDMKFYGYSDWVVDDAANPDPSKRKEISGRRESDDEDGKKLLPLPAKGEKIYDLILREQNKLFFGIAIGKDEQQKAVGRTEKDRPATISKEEYLELQ